MNKTTHYFTEALDLIICHLRHTGAEFIEFLSFISLLIVVVLSNQVDYSLLINSGLVTLGLVGMRVLDVSRLADPKISSTTTKFRLLLTIVSV